MSWPNWRKVQLIYGRELQDQLRDRRTLCMVLGVPLLLYPLLSIAALQVAQFFKQHPSRVLVIAEGPYMCGERSTPHDMAPWAPSAVTPWVEVTVHQLSSPAEFRGEGEARAHLAQGRYDLIVVLPRDFCDRAFATDSREEISAPPQEPRLYFNSAKDRSRLAYQRVYDAVRTWSDAVRRTPPAHAPQVDLGNSPSALGLHDLASLEHRQASLWSKILPFVVFVWALTGAFYPAIDLCAGEKERGTLETLLASAAERLDIVWGKLLTVVTFSVTTALLNLLCMILMVQFVGRQFVGLMGAQLTSHFGSPPIASLFWTMLALIPISILFSSLALALATMARGTKEGQYYLIPLIMAFSPLMLLALFPAARLDLGTSLLPVTGLMLCLRHVMEGEAWQVWPHLPAVTLVTLGCCLLSVRWAVEQFNNERILFRACDRFQLWVWLRHLVRDRGSIPTFAEAMLCGVFILLLRFFAAAHADLPESWEGFARLTAFGLIVFVAAPPLLMTLLLVSNPRETLLLRRPGNWTMTGAILLAILLHPAATLLSILVRTVYPLDRSLLEPFQAMFAQGPGLGQIILLLGVLPAICEELAFRGFILSGLRRAGTWRAIAISSLLFGVAHGVLQQSILASIFGGVLGFLAVRTASLWPCVAFHMVHNTLGLLSIRWLPELAQRTEFNPWWVQVASASTPESPMLFYGLGVVVPSTFLAVLLLQWFWRLPESRPGHESARGNVQPTAAAVVVSHT